MASYHEVFKNPHTVLPVVHVENPNQAIKNTALALKEGADGVFLIQMNLNNPLLINAYEAVRTQFPKSFVGLNMLGVETDQLFSKIPESASAAWTDNAHIYTDTYSLNKMVMTDLNRRASKHPALYFGGVAFKYQPEVEENMLGFISHIASKYMDVVTTSGEGTGKPPTVEKVKTMKEAIDNHPLAISSGISQSNVEGFLPYADSFLVATSILKPGKSDFDASRLRDLIATVRG